MAVLRFRHFGPMDKGGISVKIQLLQVLRGIEFQKEKQRKRTRQTTFVLEQ